MVAQELLRLRKCVLHPDLLEAAGQATAAVFAKLLEGAPAAAADLLKAGAPEQGLMLM